MTPAVVDRALALWGMQGAPVSLAAARENRVFKVTWDAQPYALRLHRAGYRSDPELHAELAWMGEVARCGLNIPAPVTAQTGGVMQKVDGIQIDLLTWLPGEPLAAILSKRAPVERTVLFANLGREMARLHLVSDAWGLPDHFTRCAWDNSGLLGEAPLWGRFWENNALSPNDRALFTALRIKASSDLAAIEPHADYGLIHADLVPDNVMVDGASVQLIDFDDGGFGFRAFDVATALYKHRHAPDYPHLLTALISGYRSQRTINLDALDLFMVLRATSYIGWSMKRMDAAGAHERLARFITQARDLATAYLLHG